MSNESESRRSATAYILIQNPNALASTVDVTHMLQGGGTISRQHTVPANARYTIVTQDPAEVGPEQGFSTKLVGSQPIIVERAMYFGAGGHGTIGVTAPASTWYLAEGFTGSGFGTFILIQNPNASPATVDVTYMLQGGGTLTRQHTVLANARYTIVAQDPAEVGPDQAFSTKLVGSQSIIVERAMGRAGGSRAWRTRPAAARPGASLILPRPFTRSAGPTAHDQPPFHANQLPQPRARQPRHDLADVPVLGGRRLGQRLAPIYLGHLALGGAGLLCVEAPAVEAAGRITPGCLGLYSDENERALERVVRAVRAASPLKLAIQIGHAGRKASSAVPWRGGQLLPADQGGWRTVAPSALPQLPDEAPPEALDRAGLERVKAAFVAASGRAARLGFDALELHAAGMHAASHQDAQPHGQHRMDLTDHARTGSKHNRARSRTNKGLVASLT